MANRLAILEGFNGHHRKRRRKGRKARASHRRSHRRARRSGGRRKLTRQNIKFRTAVRACWAKMKAGNITVSPKALGACMRKEMK